MDFIIHLFLPHNSNNHRPRVLHNASLLILIFFLLIFGFSLSIIEKKVPSVLGLTTEITLSELVELTNKERIENELQPLFLDEQLSLAAQEKANDMFSQNYWAHSAPNGRTPWSFITGSGYQYIYAGENLARDFSKTDGVLSAWMASPGHRANILSSNYQDIGFAVVNGKLNGRETTLVVQLFGTKKGGMQELSQAKVLNQQVSFQRPLVDSRFFTRNISVSILGFLIAVLIFDMAVAHRKRLVRLVGHNLDHIIFLGSLIPTIIMGKGGAII